MVYALITCDLSDFASGVVRDDDREASYLLQLLNFWREYGTFVELESQSILALRSNPSLLSVNLRKQLSVVLKQLQNANRLQVSGRSFSELYGCLTSDLEVDFIREFGVELVALTEQAFSEVARGNPSPTVVKPTGVEACSYLSLNLSDAKRRVDSYRSSAISEDEDQQWIWRSRLRPFIETSFQVHCVDRYALVNFFNANQPERSGLGALLSGFAELGPAETRLEVITAYTGINSSRNPRVTAEARRLAARRKFEEFCQKIGLRHVTVYAAMDRFASENFHDRYILGSAGETIFLGNGLDVLTPAPRQKLSSFNMARTSAPVERDLLRILSGRRRHLDEIWAS